MNKAFKTRETLGIAIITWGNKYRSTRKYAQNVKVDFNNNMTCWCLIYYVRD